VSQRFGVVREHQAFAFNEVDRPIHVSRELDALVSLQWSGKVLRLYDVAAPRLPALGEVVARVGRPVERVECYFTADELDPRLKPEPHVFGGERLMVRGPLPPEGKALMLGHPARC
jgi:hypothetical protein